MDRNIFSEVKEKLDITSVIDHYGVKVNRGKQFVCPFHNDHKPSASIKNDYFYCFVCGAGGDVIKFVAMYLGISNLDATKELIKEFNLNIDLESEEEQREAERKEIETKSELKKELKKCDNVKDKFKKVNEITKSPKNKKIYALRNEVRKSEKEELEKKEDYIHHVGLLLADIHRYLWQGIHLYPYEDKRHIQGLQEITVLQYWIDCYEKDPEEFCRKGRGILKRYEGIIDRTDK